MAADSRPLKNLSIELSRFEKIIRIMDRMESMEKIARFEFAGN